MATVAWSEEWLNGENYRVEVSVDFRDSKEVTIKTGSDHETLTTLTRSSGKSSWTLAGLNTDYGPASLGTPFDAFAKNLGDGALVTKNIGSHFVGSNEQPSRPMFLNSLRGGTDPNRPVGCSSRSRPKPTRTG